MTMPATMPNSGGPRMRAAVADRYGPPQVVRHGEVDMPSVGDDEVLVKVYAGTVNRTDCAYRTARPFFMRILTGLLRPRRQVLGTEFAGVVAAVGPAVTAFHGGDRVFGYHERGGAHAEYLAVPADGMIATIPANVGVRVAAAGTEGAHYAWAFLRRAGISEGDDVLVHGAGGAIGSAAVQLLKSEGARVTSVGDTAHLDLLRDLGADRVIDRTTEDFTRDPHTYDAVFDAVGKSTFGRCRRLLAPGGVYLSAELGPWAQNLYLPLLTRFSRGPRVRFPFPTASQELARHLAGLMGSGQFRPVLDRSYPLAQIVEAYRYVETGRKTGSVIVEIVPGEVES